MKKLMILGGSILQLPAILKAKSLGYETYVVDKDINVVGFHFADYQINISTLDTERVIKSAREYKVDGIITIASDMPMMTVATVAQELSLNAVSVDTALACTNKIFMRDRLSINGIPIPKYFPIKSLDDLKEKLIYMGFPCIIKASDNSGKRGITMLDATSSQEDIENAFYYAKSNSRYDNILIEEFISGPEVSVETFTIDGKVYVVAITDKVNTGPPHFVEIGHSQPSNLDVNIRRQIESIAKRAVLALGIYDGPSHTEIIVTSDGPKIVEVGARLGGDNITTDLVPLTTGVDMVKATIDYALRIQPDVTPTISKAAAIRYYVHDKAGILTSIDGVSRATEFKYVKKIQFTKSIGDNIQILKNSSNRIAYVICQADYVEEAINSCNEALRNIIIEIS